MNTLFTIGFTKKSAEEFFSLLRNNRVTLIADVRLNNSGQLAGFTKAKDLKFFLSLFRIKYQHWKNFAPTKEIRKQYHSDWDFDKYIELYTKLLLKRDTISNLKADDFKVETICLLCSEATPEKCHRRIAANLITKAFPAISVNHL